MNKAGAHIQVAAVENPDCINPTFLSATKKFVCVFEPFK
jgi:hypothetical protein